MVDYQSTNHSTISAHTNPLGLFGPWLWFFIGDAKKLTLASGLPKNPFEHGS
jgi:hypothetical protein